MENIQKIAYLLNKFGPDGTNIIKLIKLMVIADVYKLRKYGSELLQREEYFALRNGPVPSSTTDLIDHANEYLSEQELEMSKKMWERVPERNNTWDMVRIKGKVNEDYLSEIDREVIDYAFENYSDYTPENLIKEVHKYHAWKKYETDLNDGNCKRVKIEKIDFFEDDEGPAKVEKNTLADSKQYFLETV